MAASRTHRRTGWLAPCLALLCGTVLIAGCAQDAAPAGPQPVPGQWRLTWADEFTGSAGAAPDPSVWQHDTGGDGWGNSEREFYTADPANAALDGDSHLAITARQDTSGAHTCWYGSCAYTSARLTTLGTFTQQYGRIDARIRVPHGRGIWPAFWMLGADNASVGWPDDGEIDVMEYLGHDVRTVHGSLHGPGPGYAGDGITAAYRLSAGQSFADDFHVFSIAWAPGSISWYVDGHRYQTRTPDDTGSDGWVFDHPFYLLLNLAVGGSWPGDPDDSTEFPQTMLIDYVRVYAAA